MAKKENDCIKSVSEMKILAFGEVLWDIYPEKSVIGGASFNFASHCAKLGAKVDILTAIGYDELGGETIKVIRKNDVSDKYVVVNDYPTGACFVTIDKNGIPSYELRYDMAYDHIKLDNRKRALLNSENYEALYFGTLALRHSDSLSTLREVVSNCNFKNIFYDINIRQNWYNYDVVKEGLNLCSILKVSREESNVFNELGLVKTCRLNSDKNYDFYEKLCKEIAENYDIKLILFTLDKEGSMIYIKENDNFIFSDTPKGKPISTVGAGDSFSAGFLTSYLKGESIKKSLAKATALSDFVVQNIEAIPTYSDQLIKFLKS